MWQWLDAGKQETSGKEKISFMFEGFFKRLQITRDAQMWQWVDLMRALFAFRFLI